MNRGRGTLRLSAITLALTASGVVATASAEDFDDRWYLAPMGSYVIADDARSTDDGYGAVLALGKRLSPHLELEVRGQYLNYDAKDRRRRVLGIPIGPAPQDVEIWSGGIGANLFLSPSGQGLYLHADAMAGDATLYNAGVGLVFGTDVALRIEALYHIDDEADVEETQFNLGVRVALGAKPEPPRPEPVRVVPPLPTPPPPAQCADGIDNDGDGLIDFPADPGCSSAGDDDETNPPCALPEPGQAVDFAGCAIGDTLVLHGVSFEFDKATLRANAKTLLDQVAAALLRRPDIKVEVAGHTDSKGSDAYNQRLSEARASAVVAYLIGRGVEFARMRAAGYGETLPVADNATDEGRERNRRVELEVLESIYAAPAAAPTPTPAVPETEVATPPAPAPADAPFALQPQFEPTPAAAAAAPMVRMAGHQFAPATLTVAAGTRVIFENDDGSTHVVSFADTESGRLRSGDRYERTFDAPGTYAYDCAIHPMMQGTIIVQ